MPRIMMSCMVHYLSPTEMTLLLPQQSTTGSFQPQLLRVSTMRLLLSPLDGWTDGGSCCEHGLVERHASTAFWWQIRDELLAQRPVSERSHVGSYLGSTPGEWLGRRVNHRDIRHCYMHWRHHALPTDTHKIKHVCCFSTTQLTESGVGTFTLRCYVNPVNQPAQLRQCLLRIAATRPKISVVVSPVTNRCSESVKNYSLIYQLRFRH